MSTPTASAFDAVLERMYQRAGVDTLSAHMEKTSGITAGLIFSRALIDAVFRVCRDPKTAPAAPGFLASDLRDGGRVDQLDSIGWDQVTGL